MLALVREGRTDAEIAVRLGLSPETVKSHVASMLAKLDLHDRRELAAWAPAATPSRRWLLFFLAAARRAGSPAGHLPALLTPGAGPVILAGAFVAAGLTAWGVVTVMRGSADVPPPVTVTATATATAPPVTAISPTPTPSSAPADAWSALRARPLQIPSLEPGTPCPVSPPRRLSAGLAPGLGPGPAYPVGLPSGLFLYGTGPQWGGGWGGEKMLWALDSDVRYPVLVRGRQLDGPNEVRFGGGADPPVELRLRPDGGATAVGAQAFFLYPSYTRLRAPGCYAYQMDGEGFSHVVVFEAREAGVGDGKFAPALGLGSSLPGGQRLAVTLAASSAPASSWVVEVADDGAGSRGIRLREGARHVRWSPDGAGLAFDVPGLFDPEAAEVDVAEADGSSAATLALGALEPVWSADGTRIVVVSPFSDEGWGLYVQRVDGPSGAVRLLARGPDWWGVAWSPDGAAIGAVAERDDDAEIYRIAVPTGGEPLRLTNSPGFDGHPAWSPDGRRIAFVSDRDGAWRIYVMDADGSNVRRISEGPGSDWAPAWSWHGDYIGFISNRDGQPEFYAVRPDGSGDVRLTYSEHGWVESFAWGPPVSGQ